MSSRPIGRVSRDEQGYSLVLEREYPVEIERVWQALVDPARLRGWLGNVVIDARVGGSFEIDFDGEDRAGGPILCYDPPRVLEFEWGERGEPSVVRFELEPVASGTRLRLTHSLQSASMARGTCAGWHAHLDLFEAALLGGDAKWEEVYAAAQPLYEGSVHGRAEGAQ